MVKGCSFPADIFDENKLPLGEKTFSVKLPNAEEEGVASPSVFHLLLDSQALGILSEKAPSIKIFGLQHLVVEGLPNFDPNAPSSCRFYKLANPVDARD